MTIRLHSDECTFRDIERALGKRDAVRIDAIDIPARYAAWALDLIRAGYLLGRKEGAAEVQVGRPNSLSDDQCIAIRQAYRNGTTQGQLAQKYGVSRPTIAKAIHER